MPEPTAIFTKADVAQHNSRTDCWVILFGRVLNLTSLVSANPGPLAEPIVAHAGEDVSYWFDAASGEPKTYIDPVTQRQSPYLPQGPFLHIPVAEPTTVEGPPEGTPWWRDEQYQIGVLTQRPRRIRFVNTLTSQAEIHEFGGEETVAAMHQKYALYNAECADYVWKGWVNGAFRPLQPELTLAENGVVDHGPEMESLGIDGEAEEMLTTILLEFK